MASLGRRKLLYCLLLLSMCCWCGSAQEMVLTLGDMFPFGTGEGDQELPTGNDAAVNVTLDMPLTFYGEPRSRIIVGYVVQMYCIGRLSVYVAKV